MVPVELRLKNFLSYGAAAPVLDFEQFHVACLSGKNGQGKSALLDAVTWALWGEARKASDSRKPDDDLLRIGATQREVELVFDLDGGRYRVVRSYRRSASGKTSRPGLELHVLDGAAGDYRPLTGGSLRETQEHLDRLLGLDYNTFINSAFLLQGRSDEFTKKKPRDRKEILARILDLSRFDRLAERARLRLRAAEERMRQAEAEVERLTAALESVGTLQERREALDTEIEAAGTAMRALERELDRINQELAGLDATAQTLEATRASQQALQQRIRQRAADIEELQESLEAGQKLIAQEAAIRRDAERHEALMAERDELQDKLSIHASYERQVEQKRSELREKRTEVERKLERIEMQRRHDNTALMETESRLKERLALRRAHEEAKGAASEVERWAALAEKRQARADEASRLERDLHGARQKLEGTIEALSAQIEQLRRVAGPLPELERQQRQLGDRVQQLDEAEEARDRVAEQGKQVSADLHAAEARRQQAAKRLEEIRAERDAFAGLPDGPCPTCGSDLTEAHRREVEGQFVDAMRAQEAEIAQHEQAMTQHRELRDRLRREYVAHKRQTDALAGSREALARLDEQVRAAAEARDGLAERERKRAALCAELEGEQYGAETRLALRKARDAFAAIPFDEEAYERARTAAAQEAHLRTRLVELEAEATRRDETARRIERAEAETAAIRKQLDGGEILGPLQQQIRDLQARLEDVGFDGARFEAVKQELGHLREAPAQQQQLLNALLNRDRLAKRLEQSRSERGAAEQEHTKLADEVARIEAVLAGRGAVEERRQAAQTKRDQARADLQALQRSAGELDAQLAQAEADRAARAEARRVLAEARAERTTYKHLRVAFGKHGIPSLIIEETLPEIEDRANRLLHRLTDGRMSVKLETLKDKKTGGTKETLDIIITDEQGTARPYETFSGGEAFRVNFALRIALAGLLAERSGVRVRTLVVDEGFGTQDAQGVQNLIEAIHTVQDDFDKILIITHLRQLKEAFPVRIEVEKDPVEGSRFEMIGV